MADSPIAVLVDPPRGAYQTRVDDKGRLKLPAVFVQYLKDLGEEKVFITSLDTITARLYPISVWKRNEIVWGSETEDPEASVDTAFIANHYGADSEVDAQGRVLVPTELRRELALENSTVHLEYNQGAVNIHSAAQYEQRLARAKDNLAGKLKKMQQRGLK